MTHFVQKNLWEDTCPNRLERPALSQSVSCDVAIIGGGFTGLSAALHLAKQGKKVTLLEARTFGYGGSGRNVGLVNAGLWLKPYEIIERIGQDQGTALLKYLSDAPNAVYDLITHYNIDCESKKIGTLHCAADASGEKDLKERKAQWADFGVNLDLLNAAETKGLTGTSAYQAALHDMRAGTVQPLAYAHGLAHAAVQEGADLYEHSEVLDVQYTNGKWSLRTQKGDVTADKVISVTGGYNARQTDWIAPDTSSLYYFQLATEPLSQEELSQILPQKHSLWDTKSVLTSVRLNDEGRLVIGSVGKLDHILSCAHRRWAKCKTTALYPILKAPKFTHEWYGRIALTNNNIPRISEPNPNWLTIWGYNGRGIAPGTVFGRTLAQIAIDGDHAHCPLTFGGLKKDAFTRVQSLAIETGASLYHLLPNS